MGQSINHHHRPLVMDYYSSLDPTSLDPSLPTIFEIVSANQLKDLISPSLRYILSFYAQRHPQYLLKLVNKYDEIYTILMALIEYRHLRDWNSTFTEKFYGIRRCRLLKIDPINTRLNASKPLYSQTRLSKKQIWLCLLFAVGLPYITEKLDLYHETLTGRYAFKDIDEARLKVHSDPNASMQNKLKIDSDWLIYKIYPSIKTGFSLISLAFYVSYLFSKSSASSPIDWLVGFKYSRYGQFDYEADDIRSIDSSRTILGKVRSKLFSSFSYILPTSMFVLKFVEWWSQSDVVHRLTKKTRGNDENLPVPEQIESDQSQSSICPICKQDIQSPAAIETGLVFCYKCIFSYLQQGDEKNGGRCPVTGQKLLLCRYSDGSWQIGGIRRLMI